MSEELPEYLKMKLMKKIIKEATKKQYEEKKQVIDPEKIVWEKLADEKAIELMKKAKALYPELYKYAVHVFYQLIVSGAVKEFDGYTTLILLNRLGIPVKPDLRIRFVKRGKEVDLKEYLD